MRSISAMESISFRRSGTNRGHRHKHGQSRSFTRTRDHFAFSAEHLHSFLKARETKPRFSGTLRNAESATVVSDDQMKPRFIPPELDPGGFGPRMLQQIVHGFLRDAKKL